MFFWTVLQMESGDYIFLTGVSVLFSVIFEVFSGNCSIHFRSQTCFGKISHLVIYQLITSLSTTEWQQLQCLLPHKLLEGFFFFLTAVAKQSWVSCLTCEIFVILQRSLTPFCLCFHHFEIIAFPIKRGETLLFKTEITLPFCLHILQFRWNKEINQMCWKHYSD